MSAAKRIDTKRFKQKIFRGWTHSSSLEVLPKVQRVSLSGSCRKNVTGTNECWGLTTGATSLQSRIALRST